MTTVANVKQTESSHWYYQDGRPCYELSKKSGPGMKRVTLREARELNLLPSVTTILKVLHKEALVQWQIEQAVLAVVTTPRQPGEADDAFIHRVLHIEEVQNEERDLARDKGTEIHAAMELWFQGRRAEISAELLPWVAPAAEAIEKRGVTVATEKCLCGLGYAGRTDLILDSPECWWVWDWKGTKKLPDPTKGGAWDEHVLQGAAYALAFGLGLSEEVRGQKPINTGNIYISTLDPGKFSICEHEPWQATYDQGFRPLVAYWQWKNRYRPKQALRSITDPAPKQSPAPAAA